MDLRKLFRNSKDALYVASGSTIFKEQDEASEMYVLLEGEVDILVGDKLVNCLQPGEIFGEMSLIDSQVRSATAIAKTRCKLARIDESRFLYMVQETPMFSLQIMRIMAERLRKKDSN